MKPNKINNKIVEEKKKSKETKCNWVLNLHHYEIKLNNDER